MRNEGEWAEEQRGRGEEEKRRRVEGRLGEGQSRRDYLSIENEQRGGRGLL
jgi:hypothetical protein